jgi:RimJ/RimL family protein N-acetyltransferase
MASRAPTTAPSSPCSSSRAADVVALRPVEPSDLPIFYEHQRDPVAVAMAGVGGRDRERFDEHWARILADDAVMIRTVVVDGEVAGNVLSFERSGRREVGYWLARDHWGRGVATAALVAFLGVERSRPLYAGVVPANGGSLRVLERCGFAVCGEDDDGLLILRLG